MPMDFDYIAGIKAIDKLEQLLSQQPHGERKEIVDEICAFVEQMKERYG